MDFSEKTNHHDAEQAHAEAPEQSATQQPSAQPSHTPDSYKEQYARIAADFANYKRRVEVERSEWMKTAQASVIKSFIPIIDDVDRAMVSAGASQDAVAKGLELIQRNCQKTLTELGVTAIDCSGSFDPHLHEALMQVDSSDHESGDIVQVLAPGYQYKGAVIRHAKVSVAK